MMRLPAVVFHIDLHNYHTVPTVENPSLTWVNREILGSETTVLMFSHPASTCGTLVWSYKPDNSDKDDSFSKESQLQTLTALQ